MLIMGNFKKKRKENKVEVESVAACSSNKRKNAPIPSVSVKNAVHIDVQIYRNCPKVKKKVKLWIFVQWT